MTIKYRRVPGYYNSSTYWFDRIGDDGVPSLVGTVKQVSAGGWDRSPTWRATHKDGERVAFGRTRAEAVKGLLRKVDARRL